MTSDQSIRWENVIAKLIEVVPELTEEFRSELRWWEGETPPVHVVYGDLLSPLIERLLASSNERALRRIFDFLEQLSNSPEKKVREVVVTVCENLPRNKHALQQARRFMGLATLKICNEVEAFWRKSDP